MSVLLDLPSVTLDEIVAAADLQTRVDRKYVVTETAANELIDRFNMAVLEIDGRRSFRYESVYFDTPQWSCYVDAARERPRRFKVRSRTYVDSGECVLEFKNRGHRDETVKKRIEYGIDERHRLTPAGRTFVEGFLPGAPELAPVLTTTYERVTLVNLENGTRVTCDFHLACTGTDEGRATIPGHVIIETKAGSNDRPADRVLWSAGFRPMSLSKYCVGVAALQPHLPRNRWTRVLSRYVTTTSTP